MDPTLDDNSRTKAVSALLIEAEAAHGVYETTVLGGVYDKDWAAWYATYAVEHGIADLIGQPVTADRLSRLLTSLFDEFERADPKPTDAWAPWIARRITTGP